MSWILNVCDSSHCHFQYEKWYSGTNCGIKKIKLDSIFLLRYQNNAVALFVYPERKFSICLSGFSEKENIFMFV
ncbi:MAG: hypothetical protein DBX53_02220 [Clostridiales bacterium]|nr:MAG: hypothetical protein DBX53_02220 [Clostridiales bacterium]